MFNKFKHLHFIEEYVRFRMYALFISVKNYRREFFIKILIHEECIYAHRKITISNELSTCDHFSSLDI